MGMIKGNPVSGIGVANGLSGGGWNPITGLLGGMLGGHGGGGDDEEEAPQAPVNPGQKMFGMGPGSDSGMVRPTDNAHKKDFGGRLLEELFRSAIGGFR